MTINDLIAFGADTDEGLRRCLNNEDFYLRMVKKVPGDPNFRKLHDALAAGDQAGAFDAVHVIKGIAANLALTPILAPAVELTEILRARSQADCTALADAIRKGRDELEIICSK